MQDRWIRPDAGHRTLPTPEQARDLYAEFAGEVLRGFPVFDRMEEAAKGRLVDDTSRVIAGIVFDYGGRYRRTSPDVAWSALSQAYSVRTAHKSAYGRFRQALDKSARVVYKTAFAMLEAGVRTKEDLANIGKPPSDELYGMRSGLMRVSTRRGIGDALLPLPVDLPEL